MRRSNDLPSESPSTLVKGLVALTFRATEQVVEHIVTKRASGADDLQAKKSPLGIDVEYRLVWQVA